MDRKNSGGGSARNLPARLPEMEASSKVNKGKKCLALDLDETLVHSSFQVIVILVVVTAFSQISLNSLWKMPVL